MENLDPQGLQGRVAEYTALKQEIIQYNQLNIFLLAISFPIAAALIAYGYTQHDALALFAAVGLLGASLWFVSAHVYTAMLIASYLYAIVESKGSGMTWEHMVYSLRGRPRTPSSSYGILWALLPLVSIGCILLAWAYAAPATLWDVGIFSVASGLLLIFQLIPLWRAYWYSSRRFYDRMCERWVKEYTSV